MQTLEEKEIRLLFQSNALGQCVIEKSDQGYCLFVTMREKPETVYLQSQRTGKRVFKSADAAVNTAVRMGFKTTLFQNESVPC